MFYKGMRICLAALAFASMLLCGCQDPSSTIDEQKETHYLRGRNRVSTQDYAGAIEEFEKALQVNPASAAAHFELAWLQEEQMKDYAAAIYHYQKHLKLKADSEYAERARERMKACKLELARTEVLSPVTQGMQSELHRLQTENMLLKTQVDTLQGQLASRAVTPAPVPAPTPVAPQTQAVVVTPPPVVHQEKPAPIKTNIPPVNSKPVSEAPKPKKYVVKSGDTIFSIARSQGLGRDGVSKLLKVNPNVEARQLKVGQTINIP